MELTKEALAVQYEKLANRELLKRVQSGTLVPLALDVACDELRSRGVDFELPNVQGESTDDALIDDGQEQCDFDFVNIASIVNPLRANLLRAHLQSEGIVVHLLGEYLGVTNLFLSAGTGGIRVQVRSDQVDRAREILTEFDQIEKTVSDESGDEPQPPNDSAADKDLQVDENSSRFSPPKSYVADVVQAKERREAINRPSTARFFWIFAIIAVAAIFYVLANGQ